MNRSEKFVYDVCNNSFFSLWSFANPLGKKDKELCDILVICEPDIIIFSVKEIYIKSNDKVGVERWLREAIKKSVNQIYGAERFIKNTEEIKLKDKKTKIKIDKNKVWNIHRIAVCFGRGEKFPISFGNFSKGYVHVFDEKSFPIILRELDTISDFIEYLTAKEKLFGSSKSINLIGEEDLLAYYLSSGFSFPEKADTIIFSGSMWKGLLKDEDYKKYKKDMEISYQWDRIINIIIEDFRENKLITETKREELELTLRSMARENRESRKLLSEQFMDFISMKSESKSVSRIVQSLKNPELMYLFLLGESNDREYRQNELSLRCFVARYIFEKSKIVIGIATEKLNPNKGFSLDFTYLHFPKMTEEQIEKARKIIEELGYFKDPQIRKI